MAKVLFYDIVKGNSYRDGLNALGESDWEGWQAMAENIICRITITGMENQEWQGVVYFPDSEERRPFQSVLELIKAVERNAGPPVGRSWNDPEE